MQAQVNIVVVVVAVVVVVEVETVAVVVVVGFVASAADMVVASVVVGAVVVDKVVAVVVVVEVETVAVVAVVGVVVVVVVGVGGAEGGRVNITLGSYGCGDVKGSDGNVGGGGYVIGIGAGVVVVVVDWSVIDVKVGFVGVIAV
uniref:Uncharacterized protein n=1 Tax=Panagrolaimus davidi TaxID=227884 RepID=A0A914QAQ2_9BILA